MEFRLQNVLSKTRSHCGKCRPLARSRGGRHDYTRSNNHATPGALEQGGNRAKAGRAKAEKEERDLLWSVLNASTTKRDAKSYISQFKPAEKQPDHDANSSKTVHEERWSDIAARSSFDMHISLIKIRNIDVLDNTVVSGLVSTLSQLARLGIRSVIVLELNETSKRQGSTSSPSDRSTIGLQADRLVSAIQNETPMNSCRLDHVVGFTPVEEECSPSVPVRGAVHVQFRKSFLDPLKRGLVPVFAPFAYTTETQRSVHVDADEIVLALTRELAGLLDSSETPITNSQGLRVRVVLDRLIILDPLGGLPSSIRADKAHIFVNLEQEFKDIKQELMQGNAPVEQDGAGSLGPSFEASSWVLGQNQPDREHTGRTLQRRPHEADLEDERTRPYNKHIMNLELARKALALLPPGSSALLTSPTDAATFADNRESDNVSLGVGTRTPKNPLIYNLLTDKPLFSSSLPVARLSLANKQCTAVAPNRATFFKRGMPLTIIPDPRHGEWEPPKPSDKAFSLSDPRIDFPRLLNLIEDSFNRPLDVQHYLQRIGNRIAGIIVAGKYEGGAILTWELPPGVPDVPENAHRMVPYLDKFAVLKRAQGTGGVADIVFTAMVRSCFPGGVCWRSRKDNPVNKWYFERSVGTWKLPDSQWTMFWTTPNVQRDSQKFKDYEAVCRSVKPSWADNKQVVD